MLAYIWGRCPRGRVVRRTFMWLHGCTVDCAFSDKRAYTCKSLYSLIHLSEIIKPKASHIPVEASRYRIFIYKRPDWPLSSSTRC